MSRAAATPNVGNMLKLSEITKRFGDRHVLDEVSFDVPHGRLTGFVGANGAGKTTTMRIVLGLLNHDSGCVSLDGKPLSFDERHRIGYMPEERGLYPKMKVLEQITYLARLRGLSKREARERSADVLGQLGLDERLDDRIEALSLGNQQRAQIAAALVHDPQLLILDEPFSGLDPVAVDTVVRVLEARAQAGAAVLFSSHQLDVVERLCDDLVIIADGFVRAHGPRESMRDEHASLRYELITSGDTGWLRQVHGVTVVEFDGGHAIVEVDGVETAQYVLRRAVEEGNVASFAPQFPSLAQIFKEIVS